MTTGYIEESILISMLQCLTADNALCIRCLLATGMRINDCLSLKREAVKATYSMNPLSPLLIYREAKTGKLREAHLSPQLCLELTEKRMVFPWAGRYKAPNEASGVEGLKAGVEAL